MNVHCIHVCVHTICVCMDGCYVSTYNIHVYIFVDTVYTLVYMHTEWIYMRVYILIDIHPHRL